MADDDYFEQMAVYVKNNLNPNLKVYVEYSNEAWNSAFDQFRYFKKLANANGTLRHHEYGKRAKALFETWMDVYGEESDKLVRVIGTHFHNPWVGEKILEIEGLAEITDALAVGYYIGNRIDRDQALYMSNAEIFYYLNGEGMEEARELLIENKTIAEEHGLKLFAYEAGQHLLATHKYPELVEKFADVNRDQRMGDVYQNMYDLWIEIGGDLITWFQTSSHYTKWGYWGLYEVGKELEDSPKYQAVMDMMEKEGC